LPEAREPAASGRAFWSGTITFGLVSIPVDLYAAVRPRRTALKMVDAKGKPLGRRYYCPKDGTELSNDDLVRGFEADKGKMVVVTDEELERIAPEKTRDIELRRFVPAGDIPPAYYQRSYVLAPSGKSNKAYHLLAETMQRTGKVGIGSFVMRDHEYLVAIVSEGGVLRAETLRFADELHSPADVGLPKRKKAPTSRVAAFTKAIAAATRDELDPEEMSDRYAAAIEALAASKQKKRADVVRLAGAEEEDGEFAGGNVIDLMAVLRRSISSKATVATAAESADSAAAEQPKRRGPRKRAGAQSAGAKRATAKRAASKKRASRK
jgi:DNA end-binding protein Ku